MLIFRYVIVQGSAFAIDFSIFFILNTFTLTTPIMSNLLAKVVAGCFGFYFQRGYVFQASQSSLIAFQAVRFISILVMNNLLQIIVMAILNIFLASPVLAKIVADVSCILLSYFAARYFIFPSKRL